MPIVGPNNRLYLLFDNGKVLSLDTSGTSYEMSLINRMPNDTTHGLLSGTTLFANDTANTMAAFETQPGSRLWQRTHTTAIGEPVIVNGELYYPTDVPSLLRVNPESGRKLSEITFPSRIQPSNISEPPLIVSDACEQSTKPAIYGTIPTSSGGVFAYTPDGDTFQWTKNIEYVHNDSVVTGGALFTTSDSTIYRLNAQTGQTAWQRELAIDDGQIAFVTPDAVVVWSRKKLIAVSPSNGSWLWESGLQAVEDNGVIGTPHTVYVILDTNPLTVVGLDLQSGLERWRRPFCQGREWRSPALTDQFLIIPADQNVYAFSNESDPRQILTNETAANDTAGN